MRAGNAFRLAYRAAPLFFSALFSAFFKDRLWPLESGHRTFGIIERLCGDAPCPRGTALLGWLPRTIDWTGEIIYSKLTDSFYGYISPLFRMKCDGGAGAHLRSSPFDFRAAWKSAVP